MLQVSATADRSVSTSMGARNGWSEQQLSLSLSLSRSLFLSLSLSLSHARRATCASEIREVPWLFPLLNQFGDQHGTSRVRIFEIILFLLSERFLIGTLPLYDRGARLQWGRRSPCKSMTCWHRSRRSSAKPSKPPPPASKALEFMWSSTRRIRPAKCPRLSSSRSDAKSVSNRRRMWEMTVSWRYTSPHLATNDLSKFQVCLSGVKC